jgi:hypothetical protein
MDRAGELAILKSLLHYSQTKSTAMADDLWQNPVSAYTCPDRHRREEQVLIRVRPLVWGLSCDWPRPGSYRTDDYSGIPVLTVRGRDGRLRAFINTCRHRGAKVASGEGEARSFTCPYHAPSPALITPGVIATMARYAQCQRPPVSPGCWKAAQA